LQDALDIKLEKKSMKDDEMRWIENRMFGGKMK
jgi:hypothetical protein